MAPLIISDDDAPGILSLLQKYARVYRENVGYAELQASVAAEIAKNVEKMEQLHVAFAAFGINTKAGGFSELRMAVGDVAYNAALQKGGYHASELNWTQPNSPEPPTDTLAIVTAPPAEADAGLSVRELVLAQLQAAGAAGNTAAAIRKYIEDVRKTKLHDKTVGMTLYRLSQDGLARREGRTWFFVQEAKNPSAEDAGAH